jgi:hypothetical protein
MAMKEFLVLVLAEVLCYGLTARPLVRYFEGAAISVSPLQAQFCDRRATA